EFNAPLLTDTDQKICERIVALDSWMGSQLSFSPKSSFFQDSEGFVSRGLVEVAIYDPSILSFMNTEEDFSNWWNENIFQEAIHVVSDMGRRYYAMMNDKLLNKISRNSEDLELAILGQQSHTQWNYTEWFLLDGFVDWAYYYRDFYRDLVNGWVDSEVEHRNFKQSEDLFEAFASEFGILSNYLAVTLQKLGEDIVEQQASDPATANTDGPDAASPLIIEDSSAFSGPTQLDMFMDPTAQFLPEALVEESPENMSEISTDRYVQEVSESIKNIKSAFLHVLETWDSVNISNYYEKKEALETQLNRLATLIVPVENALDMVKTMQARDDQDIYVNTVDPLALLLLKRKPAMVILNAMAEIIDEVHMLRGMRMAESFDFNLEK
ncbi:MAG: hypothetical protein MJK18_10770, partial [Bdellovibrionales bacterium]|nr:hypothetical protein [Bdellovibrionales bacterium]